MRRGNGKTANVNPSSRFGSADKIGGSFAWRGNAALGAAFPERLDSGDLSLRVTAHSRSNALVSQDPSKILLTNDASRRQDLEAYRAEGGYSAFRDWIHRESPAALLDEIESSKLRGRGGARFPTATKLRLAAATTSDQKYVVANGGEHEPGSDKDKHLVEFYPHKVLEGLALTALATGATRGYVYLIEDMAGPLQSMEAALVEARTAGLLGRGILGTQHALDVEIHRAPTTYVAGEETAALDSIEGGPGKPRKKPPYPGQEGLFGKPTTVQNVETLAHIAWIAREGSQAFAQIGTAESTGTMLFTLPPVLVRPGVHEMPFGVTYRELLESAGGGLRGGRSVRALLPALSSSFLAAGDLDVEISYEALAARGSSPGCGGIHLVLDDEDPVERVAEIARFFMREQCGQCPACRMETNQFVHVLDGVLAGKKGDFEAQLEKLATFARGKGFCSLIEMAAAPVVSGAKLFADEFRAKAAD